MKLCNVWSQKLQLTRKKTGALSGIDLLLANTSIDEDGKIVVYNFRVEQVVSEFMILANIIVADTAAKGNLPFLYRNQAAKSIAPTAIKNCMNEAIISDRLESSKSLCNQVVILPPKVNRSVDKSRR